MPMHPARRVLVATSAAIVAVLAAGCSTSSTPTAQSSSTVAASPTAAASTGPAAQPTTAAPSPAPAGPQPCSTGYLGLKQGLGQGTAGALHQDFVLTNIGNMTCTLYGFPGVSLSAGTPAEQIGEPASRLSPPSPTVVTLAPGQQANFNVNFEDAGNYPASKCGPENATDLVVYPPDQTTPIYFAFSAQTCSATSLVTMHVTVIQPGNGGA